VTEQMHDDIDWAEVERRALHRQLLGLLVVPVVLGSIVLLTGKFTFWQGADAWWVVGGFTAYAVVAMAASRATLRIRRRADQGLRVQYAMRHHVDPGPELREKVDRYARMMAGNGWMTWLIPFTPGCFLLGARWDRPLVAVPAILVVVAVVVALVLWWRRLVAAARRWVADPPGPERDAYALKGWERWVSGRRLLWLLLGFAVVNVVGIAVLVLVLR
jgi:hypothetical protein